MLYNRYQHLESWTQDRRAELARIAATEAQLQALRNLGRASWTRRAVARLGQAIVSLGTRLQSSGNLQPGVEV